MARILTNILFLFLFTSSFGQNKFFFSTNTPPVSGGAPVVSIFSFDTKETAAGNTINHLVSVPAGALLLLSTASDLNASTSTITSSPSLTWTQRSFGNGATGGSALIYTAIFTAGGTIDVTSNFLGLNAFYTASCLYAIQGQEVTLGGNQATGLSQVTATTSITTTRANSLIFCTASNWNAIDGGTNGASIVFSGSAFKNYYTRDVSHATTVHFNYNPVTAQAYTVGFTSPTDPDSGTNMAVYEVRGQ